MWLVRYALKHPYSMGALAILVVLFGLASLRKLPVDILPEVDTPIVNVVWTYPGLNAREMASKITSFSELALLNNVDNVREITSQTTNGVGLVRVVFQDQVEIDLALSQVASISQTILRRMPPGTSPPIVVRNVPCRTKGCMVDTLVSRSDEGRDMAAISFGEVPNNLRSGNF